MANLFDTVEGNYTSATTTSIADSSAEWKVDQFKNWYVIVSGTEYKITSNTTNTLSFANSLPGTGSYKIIFIYRAYLLTLESDLSNTTKIPDSLLDLKYDPTNTKISNEVFAYIRVNFTSTFDPTQNMLNQYVMQEAFAYYMLYLIYLDLMISGDSFDKLKMEINYNQYKEDLKNNKALLQLDFDEDGEADFNEEKNSVSTSFFGR